MIKTNEYYKTFYGRTNNLKRGFLAFFFGISSDSRITIEIFLRRHFGIRYFSLFHCIRLGITLFLLPFFLPTSHGQSWHHTLLANWGWYLYLAAFCKFSWDRYKECRRPDGYFDFNHFTKFEGRSIPQILAITFNGKPLSPRTRNVYLEPLIAIAVGLVALLVGQWLLAMLLIICAIIHSLSYMSAYLLGRDFLLDKIDGDILGRDVSESFLNDNPGTSNFNFYGPKPTTAEAREGLANLFRSDDEGTEVK